MSHLPHNPNDQYPQQQPTYPATTPGPGYDAQPPYGQPGGSLQPGYGQMPPAPTAGYGTDPAKRPGMVTAAAVLAFVVGGLTLLGSLIVFGLSGSLDIPGYGFLKFLAAVQIALGAALIWGGVQAMNGRDARILVVTAAASIVLQLISMVIYFQANSVFGFVIPVLIIVFLLNQNSKAWLDRKGARHF